MNRRKIFALLPLLAVLLLVAAPVAASTFGTRPLGLGASGSDVRELQRMLQIRGFRPGALDGVYGRHTQEAVKAYQRSVGLPMVGVVGPQTTASLLKSPGGTYTVQRGDSLYGIARSHNTTADRLRSLNNLRTDTILVGQRLTVLGGQAATAVPSASTAKQRFSLTQAERDALAKLIHAESQGEPFAGQVAVAAVVFNRVSDKRFPNTIRGVLYQPYQFEPILNGWAYKPAGPEAYRALDAALAGQDPTSGAVFFYNPVKAPHSWMATRTVVAKIGNHVFMK